MAAGEDNPGRPVNTGINPAGIKVIRGRGKVPVISSFDGKKGSRYPGKICCIPALFESEWYGHEVIQLVRLRKIYLFQSSNNAMTTCA
jgi:hypothetical protein